MNHTELRDFPSKTLQLISGLIEKRTVEIRKTPFIERSFDDQDELDVLIGFQTQVEYAKMLVLREERVLNS